MRLSIIRIASGMDENQSLQKTYAIETRNKGEEVSETYYARKHSMHRMLQSRTPESSCNKKEIQAAQAVFSPCLIAQD